MRTYKESEFKAFISLIEEGQVKHWIQIAKVLDINKNTITAWKKLPEAQEAVAKGVSHALACMEQAGARDWRMWQAKATMLGVTVSQNIEATLVNDPRVEVLKKYGLFDEPL